MSSLGRPVDAAPRVGRIRISSASTDKGVGRYVSRNFVDTSGALQTCASADDALQVRIAPADRSEAVQILNSFSDLTWLGLAYKQSNNNFGKNATGWASLTTTSAPGTTPMKIVATDPFTGPIHAAIWNVTLDGRFIANVCDADGIFYKVEPVIQLNQPGIYFVHHKSAFYKNNTVRAYAEVELIFEPIPNYGSSTGGMVIQPRAL
ncbi:hypothetical protein FRC04_011997 [Tulasnella sp. 424]|nr:hypothetical protein FRC04_011997 [Tulasnella sp. 424]KAG8971240.1 hypothetical protein FRC05_011339 [Tulasnella sp. 425]